MLQLTEKPPVGHEYCDSASPVLLVCEHAGNAIPHQLNGLGLKSGEIERHVGWDIGALEVARHMSRILKAELIYQRYSRLVVDCNRPLDSDSLIPEISETTPVPGNRGLDSEERELRIQSIWQPFQDEIATTLDRHQKQARPMVLVAVHSYNPLYHGEHRPWHVSLLYNRDPRLAEAMADHLKEHCTDSVIGLNQPHPVADDEDHTIPVFGESLSIPHVLIEVRNDLIRSSDGQKEWSGHLAAAIQQCVGPLIPEL